MEQKEKALSKPEEKPKWDGGPWVPCPKAIIRVEIQCKPTTCGSCQLQEFHWDRGSNSPEREFRTCRAFGERLELSGVWSDTMGTYTGDMSEEMKRLQKCIDAEVSSDKL